MKKKNKGKNKIITKNKGTAILTIGDPLLYQVAENINFNNDDEVKSVQKHAKKMTRIMCENNAAGLAASQLGIMLKLIVIKTGWVPTDDGRTEIKTMVLANPRLIFWPFSGTIEKAEGCLSIPCRVFLVKRKKTVYCAYNDYRTGKKRVIRATGNVARAIQHEIDHLYGELLVSKGMELSNK